MSLLDPIFSYCERTDFSLFGEPLNTLSNAIFFIAAWLLWKNYRQTHKKFDEERMTLIALITAIGLGSVFFHILPNRLTMAGDVLPIALFVSFSLYICLRRLLTLPISRTLMLLAAFGLLNVLTMYVPYSYRFNGSVSYFPCLLALALIAAVLYRRHYPIARNFFKIAVLFTLSLTFRSIDILVCTKLWFGTHFLWHICNGFVVYMVAEAIRERRVAER